MTVQQNPEYKNWSPETTDSSILSDRGRGDLPLNPPLKAELIPTNGHQELNDSQLPLLPGTQTDWLEVKVDLQVVSIGDTVGNFLGVCTRKSVYIGTQCIVFIVSLVHGFAKGLFTKQRALEDIEHEQQIPQWRPNKKESNQGITINNYGNTQINIER